MFVYSTAKTKNAVSYAEQEYHNKAEIEKLSEQPSRYEAEKKELFEQLKKAREELEHRPGIDGLKQINQIAFFEVVKNLTSSREESETHKRKPRLFGGIFRKERKETYHSLLNGTYKERLGIDLKKINIKEDENSISVSGINAVRVGLEIVKIKWHKNQIEIKIEGKDESTISKKHQKYSEEMQNDINKLLESINNNDLDADMGQIITKIGEGYVRLLLAPIAMGREIRFINHLDNSVPFPEFIIGRRSLP